MQIIGRGPSGPRVGSCISTQGSGLRFPRGRCDHGGTHLCVRARQAARLVGACAGAGVMGSGTPDGAKVERRRGSRVLCVTLCLAWGPSEARAWPPRPWRRSRLGPGSPAAPPVSRLPRTCVAGTGDGVHRMQITPREFTSLLAVTPSFPQSQIYETYSASL